MFVVTIGYQPANAAVTAQVAVRAANPVPGAKTTVSYRATITRAGVLTSVRMRMPIGSTGHLTSVNGRVTRSNGYATWRPRSPFRVRVGKRLLIQIHGVRLSKYGGIMKLGMSARNAAGTRLTSGIGKLTLIAPPARMPAVAVAPFAAIPAGCPAKWPTTVAENAQVGTGAWVIPAASSGTIAAYLTRVSVRCADTVTLKVSSGKPVSVIAYRMGYYNGLGGREIWRRTNVRTVVQPSPTTGGTDSLGHPLRTVSAANWSATIAIRIDASFVPGTYLIKVSDGTSATYAPLTVRDDTGTRHAILIQQATTTWQAYNRYGGRSFYFPQAQGSGRISFDRPYLEGQGSGHFLVLEQGLVFWAESKGLDVTYWTDNDLDQFGGQLPARAGTIFLPGHDEYYSRGMRAALSQAISRGVNVASLGANAVFRRIVFTANSSRRTWDIDRYTKGLTSTKWRYLGDAYASQPLLGGEYFCTAAGTTLTTGAGWIFAGVTSGTRIPGFLAGEVDVVDPGLYKKPGLTRIAGANVGCRTVLTVPRVSVTTYTAPSGARVLNGSTFAYGCFLVRRCPSNWTVPAPTAQSQRTVGQMMANITSWATHGRSVVLSATPAKMTATVPKLSLQTQPND
jgi:hypothetical protein